MPRIRSIKPEFWTSAQVLECSPNARLMFIGLWNFADDLGRHPYNAKQVKAEVFPADDFTENTILGMLSELSKNGLIVVYTIENKDYFYITGWKHQRIDKPQSPKYPDPFSEHSTTIPGTIPPDRIGKDKIGKEKKEEVVRPKGNGHPPQKGTALPKDWKPSEDEFSYGHALGLNDDAVVRMAENMRQWASANANRSITRKSNWSAAFKGWMRREVEKIPPQLSLPPR